MASDPFIYLQFMRKVLLALPGITEGITHGNPSFHVKKKFLMCIKEDGETLAIYNEDRDKWLAKDPSVFSITNHYLNYAYVLVKLPQADPADVEQLLLDAWRYRAPKALVSAYDANV